MKKSILNVPLVAGCATSPTAQQHRTGLNISSNELKISVISRVRSTSEIADIFNTFFYRKKVNFLFIFSVKGKNLTFFLCISS